MQGALGAVHQEAMAASLIWYPLMYLVPSTEN